MDVVFHPNYLAVRHLLTAPRIAERTARYIADDGFDFAGLCEETQRMSGGEALLVRIARSLWLAEPAAGVWELPRSLDWGNFERVVEALRIASGRADLVPGAEEHELAA